MTSKLSPKLPGRCAIGGYNTQLMKYDLGKPFIESLNIYVTHHAMRYPELWPQWLGFLLMDVARDAINKSMRMNVLGNHTCLLICYFGESHVSGERPHVQNNDHWTAQIQQI